MPLKGLNSHVLSKVIFVARLKERNCTYSGGDDVLLLFSKSGLRASRRKNVNSK
jgi:hypothetical protein